MVREIVRQINKMKISKEREEQNVVESCTKVSKGAKIRN